MLLHNCFFFSSSIFQRYWRRFKAYSLLCGSRLLGERKGKGAIQLFPSLCLTSASKIARKILSSIMLVCRPLLTFQKLSALNYLWACWVEHFFPVVLSHGNVKAKLSFTHMVFGQDGRRDERPFCSIFVLYMLISDDLCASPKQTSPTIPYFRSSRCAYGASWGPLLYSQTLWTLSRITLFPLLQDISIFLHTSTTCMVRSCV